MLACDKQVDVFITSIMTVVSCLVCFLPMLLLLYCWITLVLPDLSAAV